MSIRPACFNVLAAVPPEFSSLPARRQIPIKSAPFAHWRAVDGEVVVEFYRTTQGYTIRFLGRADFAVSSKCDSVTAWPQPGTHNGTVSDLYMNQVLPMIFGQRGNLVIHASAIALPMGALGFVGPTGRGKSTLAAAFARGGVPFLSDDGLTLVRDGKSYIARPNRPSFRLCRDSEAALGLRVLASETNSDKSLIEAGPLLPFHLRPLALQALYFLGDSRPPVPTIEAVSPQLAMAELLNHSFLLDVTDHRRLRRHFQEVGDLAQAIPCYSLDFPRSYAALPQVIAAVLDHVAVKVQR